MIRTAYKICLRTPNIRGRHRLDAALRRLLETPADCLPDGIKMRLDPQEWTQIALMSGRPTEPRTAARIEVLLEPGDSFIDVGAHVGWLSFIGARRVGQGGRVVAVDPQPPYNCERTLSNALLNDFDNILVVPAALSDRDSFAEVAQQRSSDKARFTLVGPGVNDTKVRFLCPCLRLDTLIQRVPISGRVKLVKIDVEGQELEVLRGATETLSRIDNIIFETLSATADNVHLDIACLLEEEGFSLSDVESARWRPGDPALESNVWARRNGHHESK